jgi:hypothetical protein
MCSHWRQAHEVPRSAGFPLVLPKFERGFPRFHCSVPHVLACSCSLPETWHGELVLRPRVLQAGVRCAQGVSPPAPGSARGVRGRGHAARLLPVGVPRGCRQVNAQVAVCSPSGERGARSLLVHFSALFRAKARLELLCGEPVYQAILLALNTRKNSSDKSPLAKFKDLEIFT